MLDQISQAREKPGIPAGLLGIMAVACGLSVANLYYSQPLLGDIGRTFHAGSEQLGLVSMLTQIGYALGLLLIVPLGDIVERRRLIVLMLAAVTIALAGVAMSPSLGWLAVANLTVGVTTIVPQIIVPLAADMAVKHERGKVVGTVMSGLLIGILLARTVSGFIGSWFGWKTMYWLAAGMMLLLAVGLRLVLPESKAAKSLKYRELMQSLWLLAKGQPQLWEASIMGAALFAAFSTFWTTLVFFLAEPPYHFGSNIVGLFGLVGVVGATVAPLAGKMADRHGPRWVAGIAAAVTFLAFLFVGLFGHSIWGLVFGVILLDAGVQGAQISNQATIYSLVQEASNRLNSVYMVSYFVGGAIGSSLGALAWSTWKWTGVSGVGLSMTCLALGTWLIYRLRYRTKERFN